MTTKNSLRETIRGILEYLKVEQSSELYSALQKANDTELPKMFYEMSLALSELLEDKEMLNKIRVQLPDGKVVAFGEAHKYAKQMNISSGETPPLHERYVEPELEKGPDLGRYVPADQPFNPRPSNRSRSERQR